VLYPDSATDYLRALHEGLLQEIADGIDYDHACGMMAIQIGRRLLNKSQIAPGLVIVKAAAGEKLLPVIYGGNDGFTTHMVVEHEGAIYDPLASQPLAVEWYPEQTFINTGVLLRPCATKFTSLQLQRSEPTHYEDGLPSN
jgi:hypothetical protein